MNSFNSFTGAVRERLRVCIALVGLLIPLSSAWGWGTIPRDTAPAAPSATEAVGRLPETIAVDNRGSLSYSVALPIPPGRSGLQPKLSINYSSGAGNGSLGVGFSLGTGFPERISRGRSILARDGVMTGVTFGSTDKFYLDGKRLICVSGTYGSPGSVYRTEVDGFAEITASGSSNIQTFTMKTKDGLTLTFGKYSSSIDALHYAAGASSAPAFSYALKRVEDSVGNYISFTYASIADSGDNAIGEYVLKQISYAGPSPLATIKFYYNSTANRSDTNLRFVATREQASTRRLDRIDVQFDGTRSMYYELGYEAAPLNGRLRLKTLTPYVAQSSGTFSSLKSSTFSWSDTSAAAPAMTNRPTNIPTSTTEMHKFTFGYFNRDGKSDYLTAAKNFPVNLSTGSSFAASTNWYSGSEVPYRNKVATGDFNGDGLTDIIFANTGFKKLYALRSTGTAFEGLDGGSTASLAVDTTEIFRDPGAANSADLRECANREGTAMFSRITVADFNGDGRDDLLLHAFDGYVYLAFSTGTGFQTPVKSSRGLGWEGVSVYDFTMAFTGNYYPPDNYSLQPIPGDLNGDGLTDYICVVTIRNDVPQANVYTISRTIEVRMNLGNGQFSNPTQLASQMGTSSAGTPMDWLRVLHAVMPTDVNGDGLMDLLVFGDNPQDAGNPAVQKVDRRRWTLYLNKGMKSGASSPTFEMIIGAIPNTITANGESFNTFYSAFVGLYDSSLLERNIWSPAPDLTRRRGQIESSGGSGMRLEDVNRDGFPDLVWYAWSKPHFYTGNPNVTYAQVSDANKGWWVMYSTGGVPDSNGYYFKKPKRLTATPAGDGMWDKAVLSPTTGSGQMGTREDVLARGIDANGDGKPDWTWHLSVDGEIKELKGIVYDNGPFGDLITKVENALGETTQVTYKAGKDGSLYTPGVKVGYPIREVFSSDPVVAELSKDSGTSASADRAKYKYQYSGRRTDLSGRGDLGFHSFVTWDVQTNVLKYQFLTQSFPMTGLTARDQTYRFLSAVTDGNVSFRIISSHDNTVVFDKVMNGSNSYGTVFPFISKAVESRWEDSSTANVTVSNSANPDSEAEGIFPKALPSGAHISITAKSWFDAQTLTSEPPTTIPGSLEASDTDPSTRANEVYGYLNYSSFSGLALPGKITNGNLVQLVTDYGSGYTEKVNTTYKSKPSGTNLTGLVSTVETTVTSPGYGTETAPTKSYTYEGSTPLVRTEKLTCTDTSLNLTTTYERNDDRLRVTATKITGGGSVGTYYISKVLTFDDRFDLPVSVEDAYGHPTVTIYDALLGKPIATVDVNGARIVNEYDAFGRLTKVRDDLKQTETTTQYAFTPSSGTSWKAPQTVTVPLGATGGLALTSSYVVRTRSYGYPQGTKTSFKPAADVYYDRLGRPIRTIKEAYGSQKAITDTIYNKLGQVVATSLPYNGSPGTNIWTFTSYDPLGRVTEVIAPNGTKTATTYKGRATLVTVTGTGISAQTNATVVDAKGQTVAVWNADNVPTFSDNIGTASKTASVSFALDGFGRMRETTLRGQSASVKAKYDERGQQIELNDPDKGLWSYTYDALRRQVSQTDAKGTVTAITYDRLNRRTKRTIAEVAGPVETTNWYYYDWSPQTSPNAVAEGLKTWLLAPAREESSTSSLPGANPGKTTKAFYYTDKGEVDLTLSVIDGKYFYTHRSYDDYGRVAAERHYWRPSGLESPTNTPYAWEDFGYEYTYDSKSYVTKVKDNAGRTWWEAHSSGGYDHLDRPVKVRKGSGHWTERVYREADGLLTAIKTGPSLGATTIQNLSFDYDGVGNLIFRAGSGGTEVFTYDSLNRLKTRSLNGGSATTIASYDTGGNITSKRDVTNTASGTYVYDSQKPHAVVSAWGYAMAYDANGNVITREKASAGETWNFRYAGIDKPRWMGRTVNGVTVGSEFAYDANGSRVVHWEYDAANAAGKPTHYTRKRIYAMGATLEVNYDNVATSGVDWQMKKVRVYVPSPDGVVGAREFDAQASPGAQETSYVYHYDHLGSIESITGFGSTSSSYSVATGGRLGRYSEDPWGERRNPLTWNGPPPSTTDDGGSDSLTPRGFTGHEMLDDLGLVHMNGRIYDPLLGRFLSADLMIDNAGDLQGYNRYSYVKNRPLTLVDPTGWFSSPPSFNTYALRADMLTKQYGEVKGHQISMMANKAEAGGALTGAAIVAGAALVAEVGVTVVAKEVGSEVVDTVVETTTGIPMATSVTGIVKDAVEYGAKRLVKEGAEAAAEIVTKKGDDLAGAPVTKPVTANAVDTPSASQAGDIQSTTLPDTPAASTSVHGNSAASPKAQHGYVIKDADGNVVKTGISGQPLKVDADGNLSSPRADRQVNKLNSEGEGGYTAEVIFQVKEGPGARQAALDAEAKVAAQNIETLDDKLHKRPRP